MRSLVCCAAATAACLGCAPPASPPAAPPPAQDLTGAQTAEYERCLERNMAVAVAWELIEQQCEAQVRNENDPLHPQEP